MATLFDIHMASDLSEWTGTVNDSGKLAYSASAGMGGTTGGLAITASNAAKYVYINITALTGNYFRTRFYYNPNTISTVGSNEDWWRPYNASGVGQRGYLQYNNSNSTLIHSFRDDGGTFRSESIGSVTMSAGDYLEIFTEKSSNSSATDARQRVYKNGTLLGSGLTGYILYTTFNWDQMRYGHPGTQHASFTGIEFFDEIKATTDATAIGSTASAPTVTDISNQTGTLGTQKSVVCTIADTDSNIARCDVSTDDECLITLTASGSATVTDNGTTAPYVTGTHTDVVATLGNGIKLDRVNDIWPDTSVVETITVLVTDSLSATGSDTFTMTWSVPSGQGERRLLFTGTYAQALLALPTLTITPDTDVTGEYTLRMISTTSTPLSDTDDITINITEVGTIANNTVIIGFRRRKRRQRNVN